MKMNEQVNVHGPQGAGPQGDGRHVIAAAPFHDWIRGGPRGDHNIQNVFLVEMNEFIQFRRRNFEILNPIDEEQEDNGDIELEDIVEIQDGENDENNGDIELEDIVEVQDGENDENNGDIELEDIVEIQDGENDENNGDIELEDIVEVQDGENDENNGDIEIQDGENDENNGDIEIQDGENHGNIVNIVIVDNLNNNDDFHNDNVDDNIEVRVGQGVAEDSPQPGGSRKRPREEDGEDDEERRSKRHRRWNTFIPDSSDIDSDSDSTNCDDFSSKTGISHVNCAEVAEEDPLPGPSRKRSREEDEEDDEERRSKRFRRWKKYFEVCLDIPDSDSDSKTEISRVNCAEVAEEGPLPGPSRKRLREEDRADNGWRSTNRYRRWKKNFEESSDSDSDSTNCDDFNRKTGISHVNCAEVAEEDPLPGPSRKRSRKTDRADSSSEEEEENPRPRTSRKRSRQDDEDEDTRGSKQLKRKRKRR